jgi:hypothetical protein
MAKLIKVWDGSAWQTVGTASTVGVQGATGTQGSIGTQGTTGAQGITGTSSSITTWVKTASGGETSLTGSSDSSTTLAYTPGQEQVFINGVLQVRGSDYTATNGTSITGLAALTAGDIATVTTVNAFSVTGAVPLSTVTANGDLIVGTGPGAVGSLGVGSTGQVLSVSGGVPTWSAPTGATFVGCSLETTSQTISNNTDTYLPFTSELYDTDAMHSTVTNTSRITIPAGKGGYYEFRWSLMWANNTSGNRRARLVKNGSTYELGPVLTVAGVGLTGFSNSSVVSTVAGDYWELQVFQDCGSSLTTGSAGTIFQATKVG